MWTLEADDDSTADRITFRMAPGSIKTIGRSPGAEFIVDAALVSRLHCQVTAMADSLQVKDLDSTNGTFVNGRRVQAAELREGDTLGVGRVVLTVSRLAGSQ
jgi:pSer/pThr/pTyr-binding forkhead associated (FHA) protein